MNYNFKGFEAEQIKAVVNSDFNKVPDMAPSSFSIAYANGGTGKRPTLIIVLHTEQVDVELPLNAGVYSAAALRAQIPSEVAWEEQEDGTLLPNSEKILLGGLKGQLIMALAE